MIVPFRSYTTRIIKFQKNSKKIRKTKQYHYGFISSQNRLEKAEKEKKLKIIVPFRSYTTRNKKFQKNSKKIRKLNNTIMASFEAKIGWKRSTKRENKNYRSVPFQLDA